MSKAMKAALKEKQKKWEAEERALAAAIKDLERLERKHGQAILLRAARRLLTKRQACKTLQKQIKRARADLRDLEHRKKRRRK